MEEIGNYLYGIVGNNIELVSIIGLVIYGILSNLIKVFRF